MTTRHEFLEQLHDLLKPTQYLEIGVQHGWSLQLSKAPFNIGIDPEPLITKEQLQIPGEVHLARMTSDVFFDEYIQPDVNFGPIDFAFIDGMHLAEFAWRDFLNVAKYCHAGSVVVFDDVLPTTSEMASRKICPGDWTGDVWRVHWPLISNFPHLVVVFVDTAPTGTLVVTVFDRPIGVESFKKDGPHWVNMDNIPVAKHILDRRHAWSAPAVLDNLKDRGFGK